MQSLLGCLLALAFLLSANHCACAAPARATATPTTSPTTAAKPAAIAAPAARAPVAAPPVRQADKTKGAGKVKGTITGTSGGKSVAQWFNGACDNLHIELLDDKATVTTVVHATPNGAGCRFEVDAPAPKSLKVQAPGIYGKNTFTWHYFQQWSSADSNNTTNIVLYSVASSTWQGLMGDITGKVAGYTPDQWFGGKDKIAIKVYDASNKLVDSTKSFGNAPLSYIFKTDNPTGYRVEAPLHASTNDAVKNKLKFIWEYQEQKSTLDGRRIINVKLKDVTPHVIMTAPDVNSTLWLNQKVTIRWAGPPADTPVIIGFRCPAKSPYGVDFIPLASLPTNPGIYTWDLSTYNWPYITWKPDLNYDAQSAGFITIRGGGSGNNKDWTWSTEVPVSFMTPYVRMTNIAANSTYHAGDKLTINFEKVGLKNPKVQVLLAPVDSSATDYKEFAWDTTGNSLTIPLPTQQFHSHEFDLKVSAVGSNGAYDRVRIRINP